MYQCWTAQQYITLQYALHHCPVCILSGWLHPVCGTWSRFLAERGIPGWSARARQPRSGGCSLPARTAHPSPVLKVGTWLTLSSGPKAPSPAEAILLYPTAAGSSVPSVQYRAPGVAGDRWRQASTCPGCVFSCAAFSSLQWPGRTRCYVFSSLALSLGIGTAPVIAG